MKAKHYVTAGACIVAAFLAGKFVGHCECLRNIANTYGEDILNRDGNITDHVNEKVSIALYKKENTAEGE